MPRGSSKRKIAQVEFFGGQCHAIDNTDVYGAAQRRAERIAAQKLDIAPALAKLKRMVDTGAH